MLNGKNILSTRTVDRYSASVYNLLKVLGVRATYGYVDRVLKEHPDYPSLLSIAESLPEWGVSTEGVRGEISDISEVDYPSIVHLAGAGTAPDFAVLEEVRGGNATLLNPAGERRLLSLEEFAGIWSGVLLRVFPGKNSGEPDYAAHRRVARLEQLRFIATWLGLPALFILAFGCGLARVGILSTLVPLGLAKAVGFILCAIMTAATLGQANVLQSLCPRGKVANCARVIRSPAGRLFGVSMAEWGLLYSGGGLLSLIISLYLGDLADILFLLGLLGLLALPYTLFSVLYQAFVIRSWCWMCLVVMGMFWLESYVLRDNILSGISSGISSVVFPLSLLLGFGAVIFTWVSLKHVLVDARTAKSTEYQLIRLRRRPEYIQFELNSGDEVDLGEFPFEVVIGPRQAALTITAVVNPLCGHCWRAFNDLNQLIPIAKGNLKGVIRFLVTPNKEDETPTETEKFLDREVSLAILSLARDGELAKVREALTDWFSPDEPLSKAKYNRWREKYSLNDAHSGQAVTEVLDLHRSWAGDRGIPGTPTLFFGGRELSPGLQLSDFKIFLMRKFSTGGE